MVSFWKKRTFFVCGVVVAAASLFSWVRQVQIAELQRQNKQFNQTVSEIRQYQAEHERVNQLNVDTNELSRLRDDWNKLMQMRSKIGRLRQAAKRSLPEIRREVEATKTKITNVEQRGTNLLENRAANKISELTKDELEVLIGSVLTVAEANDGKFPASYAQMQSIWKSLPEKVRHQHIHDPNNIFLSSLFETRRLRKKEMELTGATFSVSAYSFEFIPSNRPLTTEVHSVPFLREITPRQQPDGSMARYYGFTDGKVKEMISPDGNFSVWERNHLSN